MAARLGNVVYWFCSVLAGLVALLFVYAAIFGTGSLSVWHYVIAVVVAGIMWGFGWSVRYVLRG